MGAPHLPTLDDGRVDDEPATAMSIAKEVGPSIEQGPRPGPTRLAILAIRKRDPDATASSIAKEVGVTPGRVAQLLIAAGLPIRTARSKKCGPHHKSKRLAILAAYKRDPDAPASIIANEVGTSPKYVRNVLISTGFSYVKRGPRHGPKQLAILDARKRDPDANMRTIAKAVGVSHQYVRKVLIAAGLPTRTSRYGKRGPCYGPKQSAILAARMLDPDATANSIAKAVGVSHVYVRKVLIAAGLPTRTSRSFGQGHRGPRNGPTQLAILAERRRDPYSTMRTIAKAVGVSHVYVRKVLIAAGLPTRTSRRIKGGPRYGPKQLAILAERKRDPDATISNIAKTVGVSRGYVCNFLVDAGLQTRTSRMARAASGLV